jgi:hypothetical protein
MNNNIDDMTLKMIKEIDKNMMDIIKKTFINDLADEIGSGGIFAANMVAMESIVGRLIYLGVLGYTDEKLKAVDLFNENVKDIIKYLDEKVENKQ